MTDPWYPELVGVFYFNMRISDGTICSRVKGVDIKLIDEVWFEIAAFKLGGEQCYLQMEGFHKFIVYQDCLRNLNEVRDYSYYRTNGIKKDDHLCGFIISWVLMLRRSNHAQATIEDLCLLYALKENIQTDWLVVVSENMLKVTRLESTNLPYCVFISKVLIHFGVKCVNESCESYGKSNLIDKTALHRMGLQHGLEGWLLKDEYADEGEEAARSSSAPFRPC